jgi:hypothetical protein
MTRGQHPKADPDLKIFSLTTQALG